MDAAQANRRVSVIGLGQIGGRIAARLMANGYPVTVFDVAPAACEALKVRGATVAATPALAVAGAQIVITSLRGSDVEGRAVTGPDGFLAAMGPGALHISMSTLPPQFAADMHKRHAANGTRYLSAPVQGQPQAVESGQLTAWVSGGHAGYEEAKDLLAVLASRTFWLGESAAMGPAAKLAINMVMFANVELMAEAFHFLRQCGIDPAQVGEGMTQTVFATPLFRAIAAGLAGNHASAGTNIEGSLKDLQMLAEHARDVHASLPAAAAVCAQYATAVRQGHGHLAQTGILLALASPPN